MMKVAVFSDTHANPALMIEAVGKLRPDTVIHLGDLERDADLLRSRYPEIPVYSVCGNCDACPVYPEKDVVVLGAVKAFITHGHLYDVYWGRMDRLVYAAQEEGCSIALFGHTHMAVNEEVGGVKVINPGTAGKGRELTYAFLEVFDNGGVASEIRNL